MSAQPSKLAEFAAPTRGRVKYASLTAGLLARKGEAMPATPYFAVEALDTNAGAPELSRLHQERGGEATRPESSEAQPARSGGEGVEESGEEERRLTAAAYRAASRFWRPRSKALAAPATQPAARVEPTAELFDLPPRDESAPEPAPEAAQPLAAPALAPSAKDGSRAVLSVELDLQCLARLAGHAHQRGKTAAEVIEAALNAHLRAGDDMWTI